MRPPTSANKTSDGPSPTGGPSPWLWLAMAVMIMVLIAVVSHRTRPAAAPPPAPADKTIPAAHVTVPHKTERKGVLIDSNPERFAEFARDFERETDPGQREQMMAALLAEIKANDIPGLLTFLQSAEPTELAQDLSRRLIRQWTDASPENAAAWIGTLPPEGQRALLDDVAIVWANAQPTNAVNWARSLGDETSRVQALTAVAGETIRSQPLIGLDIALGLPDSPQRDDLIRRGAMQWASEDGADTVAWVKQIPAGDLRNQVVSGVAIVWSVNEPVAAATFALNELSPGRLLDDTVVSIVQRWAQKDSAAATAWVERFPAGELRGIALENLLAQAAKPEINSPP